jgi:FkbH-like protein
LYLEKLSQQKEVKSMMEEDYLQVNISASFVIEPLKDYLEYWCEEFQLKVNLALAPYNQVFQQLLDRNSRINQGTGINFLLIRLEDWLRDQTTTSSSYQVELVKKIYEDFTKAILQSKQYAVAPSIICIIPLSPSHSFSPEIAEQIVELNRKLDTFLRAVPGFYVIDHNEIVTLYDVEEVFDPTSDEIAHIPFTQDFYAALGTFLARKIRAYITPPHKVIALDCDNTLWRGICGEDGAANVVVDKNYGFIQRFMIEKYKQGFLLVLCSKNNEDDVWEVFNNNAGMLLKREHIAAYRINWSPKPENMMNLATELKLGINSFIFLDDSSFEIEQMSINCPDVLSITLPEDASTFSSFLNHIWEFDLFNLTEEDIQRNALYKAEKQRTDEQGNYEYLKDFLQSLNIKTLLHELGEKDLERALQLTLRTNQFNLNGLRKTREDILRYIHSPAALKWIIEVEDRFGNYGLVGLLLAKEDQNKLIIETFLLSCRVLGRNIEDNILAELISFSISKGLDAIKAEFRLTEKNRPFTKFLERTNWLEDKQGNSYTYPVKKYELISSEK